jgi:hypothetical protein
MTSIETDVEAILNVASGNYTNFGETPTIKIVDEDFIWYMPPRELGIKIVRGESGEAGQDHQATVLFHIQECSIIGREKTLTRTENLFKDVYAFMGTNGYTITGFLEPKSISNVLSEFKIDVKKLKGV